MAEKFNVTRETLNRLLSLYNLSRREFINLYGLQPLVYVPELPRVAKLLFVALYAVIFALALAGNTLVVFVIVRRKCMRTATNLFLCSLACSDLLVTFFCIPFTLLQHVSSEWLGGQLGCKVLPCVQLVAVVSSTLTLTCIAMERYQGIVHPLRKKGQYTSRRACRMLGVVWTVSAIVGSPMLYVQTLKAEYDFLFDRHHVSCLESWPDLSLRRSYALFLLVALFLLPLGSMLLLYSRIGFELWVRRRVGDSSSLNSFHRHDNGKSCRRKKRAVLMMVMVVLLFAACWAPFHIVHMLFEYDVLADWCDEVTEKMWLAVVQAVAFSHSFNNPVLYAFMSRDFRQSFASLLPRPHRTHPTSH
uniref:Pyroglutamylated RFamide peptide receptor-like n=2 Tax=Lepisosteus oculatus TaxID=7918 RepID=W5NF75_LEPOC|nr:PREDICTED: pyroglutamylated RFamide peptide receptor-like [Lepisosteus oculatus]